MPTQFANTLNNHPIYADRAEKDAAGNTITTTYQKKLTAGTGITIDSSNVISATGGGGGGGGMQVYHYTYTGSAMPLFTLNELTFSVNSSGYIQVQSSTVSTAYIMILKLTNRTETAGSATHFAARRDVACKAPGDGSWNSNSTTPYVAPNISSGQDLMKLSLTSGTDVAFPQCYECTIYYNMSGTYRVVKFSVMAIVNQYASCELLISTMNG